MRGRNMGGESGSLAGFIIVGVLLALVLVGGLYGLNRYNAEKASNETAATTKEDKKTSSDTDGDDKQAAKNEDGADKSASGDSSTTQPAPTTDSTTSAGSTDKTAQSTALPHTGPTESFAGLITVMVLTFAAAHFVQARRARI